VTITGMTGPSVIEDPTATGAKHVRVLKDGSLDLVVRAGAGRVRLVLGGELDVYGVERVDRVVELAERAELPVVIDCHDLSFIDAAGVGALLRVTKRGGTVIGVHGRVRRVLDLVGLDGFGSRALVLRSVPCGLGEER
jgi:anti-anti-sigma factor